MSVVVLASTSIYRRELLSRLQLPFETRAPKVDEIALPGESPQNLAERLAAEKARAVSNEFPDALIIGSDQVAYCDGSIFGKPGTQENARKQLQQMSGREIIFHTGLSLFNSRTGRCQTEGVATHVGVRTLTELEINAYLAKEDALNCAGSAKSEGLGISLLRYIRGDDTTALIGLPLIALCNMLRNEGVALP